MTISIISILLGLALLAKHQVDLLRYHYKRAKICPEKIFATGPQSYLLTKLAAKYPKRPTVFIPVLGRRIKRPFYSEMAGALLMLLSLYWAWTYSTNFPLVLSIVLGGISWIYITKIALTFMLKLCDYPSFKLVVMALTVYPALFGVYYCLLKLIGYLSIYNFPF